MKYVSTNKLSVGEAWKLVLDVCKHTKCLDPSDFGKLIEEAKKELINISTVDEEEHNVDLFMKAVMTTATRKRKRKMGKRRQEFCELVGKYFVTSH